jgi:renalase
MMSAMPDPTTERAIAIVGAGVAGLAAARALRERGCRVAVFDKGRSAGGRVATRRREAWQFDHGAQFFTVRDARFAAALEPLRTSGAVARWPGPFRTLARGEFGPDPRPGAERWVGTPGMSALARGLASDLAVTTGQRIAALRRRGAAWELWTDDAVPVVHGPFAAVVLALPPAQATAFAAPIPQVDGGLFVTDEQLSFAAHDGGKPGRGDRATWVLHGTAAWSQSVLEADPQQSARQLVAAFARTLGTALPEVAHLEGHRWRYALAAEREGSPCVVDRAAGLALIGDAVAGGRVEGAWCSGRAAAELL